MSRFPRPFYRRERKRWYVQLDGKQINLGGEKKSAYARYHQIMADRATKPAVPVKPVPATTVVAVMDEYMEWLKHRVAEGTKAQRTLEWYDTYLQSFAAYEHESFRVADLKIDQLEPVHIYNWTDAHPGWKTGKRSAMTAVQRAFNWAARAGLLKSIGGRSPIASLEKPAQGRRDQLISLEGHFGKSHSVIYEQSGGDPFGRYRVTA